MRDVYTLSDLEAQQREEEEFTRLPEDTTNMNHYDLQSQTNADSVATADMLKGSKKRKGKNKNKKIGRAHV